MLSKVYAFRFGELCGEPAISMHSHTVPLVQWSTCLLPVMRDPGSIPRGILMCNRDSPVSVVLLHWWPRRDWSLWPRLRQASARTVARPLCQQCDNPTWSHTALLSRFHARCRSSFRFHNRHSWLLGGSPLESLQSHCIHTQFHRSSGPPVCFPSWGTRVQSPGGYLCETKILRLVLSRYKTLIFVSVCSVKMCFFAFDVLNQKQIAHAQSTSVWIVGTEAFFYKIFLQCGIIYSRNTVHLIIWKLGL
jgi:hypothetical protein